MEYGYYLDKAIGLFGQSGSGKTSIIKRLPTFHKGIPIFHNTGIIRSLFERNPDK